MGAWGTGPLDNDTAMDVVNLITMDSSKSRSILMVRLLELTTRSLDDLKTADDLKCDMAAALGACAVIADVHKGEHFYIPEPEEPDDFYLWMVELDSELMREAVHALKVYRELERVVDLGWRCEDAYMWHRVGLDGLERRLLWDAAS